MNIRYTTHNNALEFSIEFGNSILKKFYKAFPVKEIILFENCREFVFNIDHNGVGQIVTDLDCKLKKASDQNGVELCYEHSGGLLDVNIKYTSDGRVIHKYILLTAKSEFTLLNSQSDVMHSTLKLSRGGEGQPIFISDAFFIGIEFPVAINDYIENTIILRQYPYFKFSIGQSYSFPPVVYGFKQGSILEDDFVKYISDYRPTKYKIAPAIYNEWAAHDELGSGPELTEELVNKQLDKLDEIKEKTGIVFDYYTMDAFWFEENVPYTAFKKRTWDNGVAAVRKRIEDQGMKFGLWFDVNSKVVKIEDENYNRRNDEKYEMCMSDPQYLELFKNGLLYNIKNNNLRLLKLDFANFDCNNHAHTYHAPGGVASKEPSVRGLILVLEEARKAQNDLLIMAYNGFTTTLDWLASIDITRKGFAISPWWAFIFEYVYCGDPRPSEYPALQLRHSVDWYADAMVRIFKDSLFPIEAIDDCGIMVGKAETIYDLGKSQWRDGWMMNLSRGGKKIHYYGDLTLLEDDDLKFMKNSMPMFNKLRHCNTPYNTKFILGNAVLGELYGYSNSDGCSGYITVVNPVNKTQNANVSLPEWIGCENVRISSFYADGEICSEKWLEFNTTISFTLKPYDVLVYKWENAVNVYKLSGMVIMVPGQTTGLSFGKVEDKIMCIRFILENGKPNRCYTKIPSNFHIQGINIQIESVFKQNIWSGLSWNLFQLSDSDNGKVKFVNRSSEEIKFIWELWDNENVHITK